MILASARKVMGGCFVGRRRVGKPRVRWEDAVWKDDVNLLQIRNPKAAARKRKCGGKRSGRPWPENRSTRHRRKTNRPSGIVEIIVWKFIFYRPQAYLLAWASILCMLTLINMTCMWTLIFVG
jgi:hypothetical protein